MVSGQLSGGISLVPVGTWSKTCEKQKLTTVFRKHNIFIVEKSKKVEKVIEQSAVTFTYCFFFGSIPQFKNIGIFYFGYFILGLIDLKSSRDVL